MSNEHASEYDVDQPMVYQVRLKGHLGQRWMDWFEGLTITLEEDGNTLLNGLVPDQSALHGILKKVRDLGMPLLSLNSIDTHQTSGTDSDQFTAGLQEHSAIQRKLQNKYNDGKLSASLGFGIAVSKTSIVAQITARRGTNLDTGINLGLKRRRHAGGGSTLLSGHF